MSFNLKVLEGPGICSLALAHFWGTKKLPEAQLSLSLHSDPCTFSVLHQKPQIPALVPEKCGRLGIDWVIPKWYGRKLHRFSMILKDNMR